MSLPDQVATTIPFFCEWILEKNASSCGNSTSSSLYSYIENRIETEKSLDFCLTTQKYQLPGFPGIKYFMDLNWVEHIQNYDGTRPKELFMDFNVHSDYKSYDIKADFISSITGCESKAVTKKWDQNYFGNGLAFFSLLSCFNNCECPVCKNEKFIVRIEGTITVEYVEALPIQIEATHKLLENDDGKDFVIVVENQEILVHKSLLIENSTVFATMFESNNWKETMENKMVIPDFSHKIVRKAIDLCYGNKSDQPLVNEDYFMLYQFADKYDMEKLKTAIKNSITLTPSTVVTYANLFLQNYWIELVHFCIDYILWCSQYSIPIKDIELLDMQIRGMFFDRTIVNPVFLKDSKAENRSFNDEF